MRTTLRIDDDVLAAARSLARLENRSLGDVISDLARRGLRPRAPRVQPESGLPVFDVPPDAPPITPEMVRAAADGEET